MVLHETRVHGFLILRYRIGHNWFAQFLGPVVFLQAPALASRRTIDPPAPVQWKDVEATACWGEQCCNIQPVSPTWRKIYIPSTRVSRAATMQCTQPADHLGFSCQMLECVCVQISHYIS